MAELHEAERYEAVVDAPLPAGVRTEFARRAAAGTLARRTVAPIT
ncbi:hypothetical protein [Streptomyces alkaliphilus]|nr:hypothetical protein [Streptomyces alkaliphilus]